MALNGDKIQKLVEYIAALQKQREEESKLLATAAKVLEGGLGESDPKLRELLEDVVAEVLRRNPLGKR